MPGRGRVLDENTALELVVPVQLPLQRGADPDDDLRAGTRRPWADDEGRRRLAGPAGRPAKGRAVVMRLHERPRGASRAAGKQLNAPGAD